MRIAFCIIATGKYGCFVEPLADCARRFFLPGRQVDLLVFADRPPTVACHYYRTAHRPWPGSTLYRYHTMLQARSHLLDYDFVYYCDADMRLVAAVGDEILGRRTAVIHPGYGSSMRWRLPYERRRESRAAVGRGQGRRYFAGGFQGGRADEFVRAMESMRGAIDADLARGIVAVWHDESHWNRYCVDHPPTVVLPAAYCCPESWPIEGRKILSLDKNHRELRGE